MLDSNMMPLKLSYGLFLLFEPQDKKLRLIITDGNNELACRKETRSVLKRFLSSAQSQLFKGRLQLHKSDEVLTVVLKGKPVGAINLPDLEAALN